MNKLNHPSTPPDNMTRVLVYLYVNKIPLFDFAYYKDGMYKIGNDWFRPDEIVGWASTNELRKNFDLEEQIKTHKVIDNVYHEDEGNEVFVGSVKQCTDWVEKQNTYGFDIVPMTRKEIEYHNKFDK